ncbi:MarR family winged helix-turn-helix transcriptional regulator [Gordonia sp. VNK21]|uniref:MarR family winged helix-turn-helix transcriptional regulator n=1 Tax=Gordonia sp. VNK21 TaxID=3382483 RepID=UPI0038D3FA76
MTADPESADPLADPSGSVADYWHRHGFDGDEQQFLTFTALLRYQRLVADAVDSTLKKRGLNTTDYLVLMTLQLSEDGTQLISSLARHLMVHATTATLATDRLERRLFVRRSPHPTDRRATCVAITDDGRRIADEATRALTTIGFGMRDGSAGEVAQLRDAIAALLPSTGPG